MENIHQNPSTISLLKHEIQEASYINNFEM